MNTTAQPTATGTAQPLADNTTPPLTRDTMQPLGHGTTQPVVDDNTARPMANGTARPVVKGVAQPVANGTAQPVANDIAQPTANGTAQLVVKGVAQPAVQGTAGPMGDAVPSATVGTVLAVCVLHAELEVPAKSSKVGRTAIDKRPVPHRVPVGSLGLAGDRVCDTEHHGGVHQAVYAYAEADARRWSAELGRPLPAGWFGENLRIDGLPVSDAVIGARWAIGDTLLEVSAPRVPCATFQWWSQERQWVKRFTLQTDTGAYLRVLTEGAIGAGDEVRVVHTPAHGITVRDLFSGTDQHRLDRLLAEEPTLSDDVRMQIERHRKRNGVRA